MLGSIKQKLLRHAVKHPLLRRVLIQRWDLRSQKTGWSRPHPIDRELGIDTSGSLPGYILHAGKTVGDSFEVPYIGSQPSLIRQSLHMVPDLTHATLIDIGCGKGRVLAVASELPFKAVIGIEISDDLVAVARRNAAIIAKSHPDRTPIEVAAESALDWRFPAGDLVIFDYNALGHDITRRFVERLEQMIAEDAGRRIHFIYFNPVHFDVLDNSPAFHRHAVAHLAYAPDELGFGPDRSDTVVIWSDRNSPDPPIAEGLDRKLSVTKENLRAELVA